VILKDLPVAMQLAEQAGALAAATEAALKVLPETMLLAEQAAALGVVEAKAAAAALKVRPETMLLAGQVAELAAEVKEVRQRQTAIREI
jgi:hypothetical protein